MADLGGMAGYLGNPCHHRHRNGCFRPVPEQHALYHRRRNQHPVLTRTFNGDGHFHVLVWPGPVADPIAWRAIDAGVRHVAVACRQSEKEKTEGSVSLALLSESELFSSIVCKRLEGLIRMIGVKKSGAPLRGIAFLV